MGNGWKYNRFISTSLFASPEAPFHHIVTTRTSLVTGMLPSETSEQSFIEVCDHISSTRETPIDQLPSLRNIMWHLGHKETRFLKIKFLWDDLWAPIRLPCVLWASIFLGHLLAGLICINWQAYLPINKHRWLFEKYINNFCHSQAWMETFLPSRCWYMHWNGPTVGIPWFNLTWCHWSATRRVYLHLYPSEGCRTHHEEPVQTVDFNGYPVTAHDPRLCSLLHLEQVIRRLRNTRTLKD